jgi:hypothetical protein
MYPLKSILEFLLSGVSRIPTDEQADALCSMLAGLLPEMSEADIIAARQQVIVRLWGSPEVIDTVIDLIDGHLALRGLFGEPMDEESETDPDGADREA